MRILTRSLLTMALACGHAAAQAQDIELYDQPGFAGMRLALSDPAADLAGYGLGRRTASVVVKRGQWELCTQPNFGGNCIAVGPGRYAEVPQALRGNLISVRRIDAASPVPAPPGQPPGSRQPREHPQHPLYPPQPGAAPLPPWVKPGAPDAVTLYQTPDFGGATLTLAGAVNRLSDEVWNFNDTARSVLIQRGRWQLCEHADYEGE